MLKIKRIAIKEGQGHCGDKVYPFVRDVLKRRYGNSVTFCFDWEVDNIINQLKEKGHPVLEWGNNYYWGRCTTGQAILLDYVISKICEEMEILQGQKYDWSK